MGIHRGCMCHRNYILRGFNDRGSNRNEEISLNKFSVEEEKEACVDYAMHCCITNLNNGEILDEMEKAVAEGITSFKCFLVYKKKA